MRYSIGITRNLLLRPLLAVLDVGVRRSYVDLGDGRMTVRMGIWFSETVPLEEIATFGPAAWPAWAGYGVKLAPRKGVGIVTAAKNVAYVALKRPLRMRVVCVPRNAERLWISLEDRDGFLAALSDATGLPVSPHVGFWREPH